MTSTGWRRRWAAIQSASPMAKMPTATTTMSTPSASCRTPPVSRAWPVDRSRPTRPMVRPMNRPMKPRSLDEPSTAVTRTSERSMIAKYDAAPISTAISASDGVRNATSRVPIVPAMNGRSPPWRAPAPRALLGHLVALDGCHHRRRLTRCVEQDRRGGAAVHAAVVDAGEQDERLRRLEAEGDRQQQRDRHGRADARQHAHEGAQQDADGGEGEVLRREGVGHAVEEKLQSVHQRIPSRIPGGSGTSRPT